MRGIAFRVFACLIVAAAFVFPGFPGVADETLTALFKWQVPERIHEERYDQASARYVPGYVHPSRWGVIFDACMSHPANVDVPIVSYLWEIKKIEVPVQPGPLVSQFETDKCVTWATGRRETEPVQPVQPVQPAQPAQPGLTQRARLPFDDVVIFGDTTPPIAPNDPPTGGDDEEHATMPAFPSLGTYEVKLTVRDKIDRTAEFVQTVVLRDYLIVVLGDSFSAGQGNPDWRGKASGYPFLWIFSDLIDHVYPDAGPCKSTKAIAAYHTLQGAGAQVSMDDQPRWVEKRAWRSYRSAHIQGPVRLEMADPHTSVTLLSFASSGAMTVDLVDRAQRAFQREKLDCTTLDCGQIKEVEEAVGDRPIDALIMSIGGNDVGFADALRSALSEDFAPSATRSDIEQRIRSLPASYQSVADELKEKLKIGKTFITGYPIDVFSQSDGTTGAGCGIFSENTSFPSVDGASVEDAEALRDLAIKMNAEVEAAAMAHDWIFIPTQDLFHTHGYCSKAGTYFRGAEASCLMQGDVEGTMHPNEPAHDAVGFRILDELKKWLPTGGGEPVNDPVLMDEVLR